MWNAECGMANRRSLVNSAFRTPHSALAENVGLIPGVRRGGRGIPKVAIRAGRRAAAPRRTREETLLHQERLVHFLERAPGLAHRGGGRLGSGGGAPEMLGDGAQGWRGPVRPPRT